MSAQKIGLLSGCLVALNIIPYGYRIYQRKVKPVPTSWSLWTLIGLAFWLTYRSSGAKANIWPAVFGFTNPGIVTLLSLWRHGRWKPLKSYEWLCLILGIASLIAWWFVRQRQELSQYVLCLAIIADLCAAIPTLILFKNEPEKDRPGAWFLFAVGWFIALFAITDHTFANYVLPIYLIAGSSFATLLLVVPRIKRKIPLKEWI